MTTMMTKTRRIDMNSTISVLVVEPDPEAAEVKKKALENEMTPFCVAVESRLDGAVKFLECQPADVMLVELPPESDGKEIMQLIQHLQSRHTRTALVLIGQEGDGELALRLCKEGAQDFVLKEHMTNGVMARVVAFAAGRQHRKMQDAVQSAGFDESITTRVNLDKLHSLSMDMDMDGSEAGVQ